MNNLAGQKFGRWAVVKLSHIDAKQNAVWECRCQCGTLKDVVGYSLKAGQSLSCGCLVKDVGRARQTTHGASGTRTFVIWGSMKARCYNPKNSHYHRYGGRGITVCDRWLNSFENFVADMGEGVPPMQIDRIDNDKGYSPENCRWATSKQQNRNKASNTLIAIGSITKCLAEWCEQFSIQPSTVLARVSRHGLGWHEALTAPVLGRDSRAVVSKNKSGRNGVSWCSTHHRWVASISINKKKITLGRFKALEDACACRAAAECDRDSGLLQVGAAA